MTRNLTVIAALLLVLAAGCGGDGAADEPAAGTNAPTAAGDATHGGELYTATCATCHGPDARGLPNLGKDLVDSAYMDATSDTDLVAFLKVGRDAADPQNTTGVAMPPKGGNPALTDVDLADIVAYLRELSG